MSGIEGVAIESRKDHGGVPKELHRQILKNHANKTSDVLGLSQLCFHLGCVLVSAWVVNQGLMRSWGLLITGQLMLGLCAAFYFNAFHECIHNTAFASAWLNSGLGYLLGFLTFRGKEWYLLFHWAHHRFTNDPAKDPELSGSTVDRADFTDTQGSVWTELYRYGLFLSGWPFGFERLPGIVQRALGGTPSGEFWVVTPAQGRSVQLEYQVWCLIYAGLVALACRDLALARLLWYYWLLPHCIGAAHLRYYQAAEHRACTQGPYTDTTAWISSRTTTSWWFYTKLAWNMPYHAEHHAWPNVPFHHLPAVHHTIKPHRPKSGCDPAGEDGYMALHYKLLNAAIGTTNKAG